MMHPPGFFSSSEIPYSWSFWSYKAQAGPIDDGVSCIILWNQTRLEGNAVKTYPRNSVSIVEGVVVCHLFDVLGRVKRVTVNVGDLEKFGESETGRRLAAVGEGTADTGERGGEGELIRLA